MLYPLGGGSGGQGIEEDEGEDLFSSYNSGYYPGYTAALAVQSAAEKQRCSPLNLEHRRGQMNSEFINNSFTGISAFLRAIRQNCLIIWRFSLRRLD